MTNLSDEIKRRHSKKKSKKYSSWTNLLLKVIALIALIIAFKSVFFKEDIESSLNNVKRNQTTEKFNE